MLPADDAQAIGQWAHGVSFSVDGSVRIEAADRAGRERLLHNCARPPFALERLRELDCEHLIYESTKPGPGGNAPLLLTTLELCDRRAALVPPQRVRRRYLGALADGRFRAIWRAVPKVCNLGRFTPADFHVAMSGEGGTATVGRV